MKRAVSVTRERRIPADPAAVWAVVAEPRLQERVDPRCRVESAIGNWRTPGSEFTLLVRGVRLHYVVTEAIPGLRWAADVDRRGKPVATQVGELRSDGHDTLLRWTVTIYGGALMRRLARRSSERELPSWLAAVERETLPRADVPVQP